MIGDLILVAILVALGILALFVPVLPNSWKVLDFEDGISAGFFLAALFTAILVAARAFGA